MNEKMNNQQKELLESISLKTIDIMFNEKNMNVLSIIKDANNKELFFPEFYEIMYLKMITQFGMDSLIKIGINYEEFGLEPYNANTIFNDAIKHMEIRQYFTHNTSINIIKRLNEHNVFLSTDNINKIKENIEYTKREDVIANNDKVKSFLKLNNKLPEKGINSTPRKI